MGLQIQPDQGPRGDLTCVVITFPSLVLLKILEALSHGTRTLSQTQLLWGPDWHSGGQLPRIPARPCVSGVTSGPLMSLSLGVLLNKRRKTITPQRTALRIYKSECQGITFPAQSKGTVRDGHSVIA